MVHLKLENGYRLERPDKCPPNIYNIMYKCWLLKKKQRPSFKDIVELFKRYKLINNETTLASLEASKSNIDIIEIVIESKDLILDTPSYSFSNSYFSTTFRGRLIRKETIEQTVLIRQFKKEDYMEYKNELHFLKSFNHSNILKYLGTCWTQENSSISYVFELAELGPIHLYLRKNKQFKMLNIIKICSQVASAMAYITSSKCNVVHRNLAARSIHLSNENESKLTDFSLAKQMNADTKYYEEKVSEAWPVKWYPFEVFNTRRFDEASDVWSFGVMCWEMASYGDVSYKGIHVNEYKIYLAQNWQINKSQSKV